MDEGGRHLRPSEEGGTAEEQPVRRPASDGYEWVQEPQSPAPRQPQRQARPAQGQPPRQTHPTPGQSPRQARPAQGQPPRQTRPAQGQSQRRAQPAQSQSQRRAASAEEPWREQPQRPVAVEPPGYKHKRRWLSKQNLPLILLVVILLGGVLFAGGKLVSIALDYHRDRSAYNDLADAVLSGLADPNATPDPDAPQTGDHPAPSQVPISVDWESLQAINSEIVGWLYCPGKLNYPVVQTTDNDYYLHRSFDKQPNVSGTLFIDPLSTLGVTLNNVIIYGHNMKDGSMFALLDDYMDQSYYDENPVMYLLTPTKNYRIDLISGHLVESTLDNYPYYFNGDSEYMSYINDITSRSFFRTNVQMSTQYQLVTMSTCNYSSNFRDPRCLLQGFLVPIE